MNNVFLDGRPILLEREEFILVEDLYPVSKGHLIIASKHDTINNMNNLTCHKWIEIWDLLEYGQKYVKEKYNPDGFNFGCNSGEAAGQTIPVLHFHIIPRYKGDTENPRGGVRKCINGKGDY